MARKHNTKHNRGRSNYPKRLEARGLSRSPRMKYTGMSAQQIQDALAKEPRYKWVQVNTDEQGNKIITPYQRRVEVK